MSTVSGLAGENLIFLVSQPRAGSTMLQRMLGAHPDIHTTSEPWIMLHPLYALRGEDGIQTDYHAGWAHTALRSFLDSLPSGEDDYYESIRRMSGYLYQRALQGAGARLFLDKTPRYYKILPEIARTFPEAKFILLFRNPLAVLSSIIENWVETNWLGLREYRYDLLEAPEKLVAAQEQLGGAACSVRYEDVVEDPESECRRMCDHLKIEFTSDLIAYGDRKEQKWTLGDPSEVYRRDRPTTESVEKWIRRADSGQEWRLLQDYLSLLEGPVLRSMGYDPEALAEKIQRHGPNSGQFTFSLEWLVEGYPEPVPRWKYELVEHVSSVRERGAVQTMARTVDRLLDKFRT